MKCDPFACTQESIACHAAHLTAYAVLINGAKAALARWHRQSKIAHTSHKCTEEFPFPSTGTHDFRRRDESRFRDRYSSSDAIDLILGLMHSDASHDWSGIEKLAVRNHLRESFCPLWTY